MKTSSLHFSFGQVFLRSAKLYSALTIGKRSTPLPCYGKRIFSVTPQVGEITTEYAPLWQNGTLPKYAFNAKELDEETDMYYYEARYYKPPVFTSRDPMFEKYFWMTPYAYCANNPVKYVDPDGRDEYEFDKKGRIVNIIENKQVDVIRIVKTDRKGNIKYDKKGNTKVIASSRNFEAGTVTGSTYDRNSTQLDTKDNSSRVEIFEFLAENTVVEWGTII
ncbi:MAG: RHS repeat-associated core domain-containing protein [Bacteroidales bacterium]|nr:RHS repeat-associated core domain-containing protein [Bacteroidales bacterium]